MFHGAVDACFVRRFKFEESLSFVLRVYVVIRNPFSSGRYTQFCNRADVSSTWCTKEYGRRKLLELNERFKIRIARTVA